MARMTSHVQNKHNVNTDEIYFISSSFLFKLNARKVLYTSDVGSESDLTLFNDLSPDIMITETTHIPYNVFEDIFSNSSFNKLFLTHIENEESLNEWHTQLEENLKKKILICHDGMTLEI
jgi:ribonuclease BN (tRNA processing enzyme)